MFSNSRPALIFEEIVYHTNRHRRNIPWYIEIRANPLFNQDSLDNLEYIDSVLDRLRDEIVTLLRRNNVIRRRLTDQEMDSIAQGFMVISGPMERDFYCHPQFYPLFSAPTSLLADQIANLIQSNDSVNVRQLVFRFEFDERIMWGGSNGKIPKGVSNRVADTWKDQYWEGNKINCAIYAITHRVYKRWKAPAKRRFL
jgi:hypothetical protein